MRMLILASFVILLLVGCATERDTSTEKSSQLREQWRGMVVLPIPTPQPDGSIAMVPSPVRFELDRQQESGEQSSTTERALTRADAQAMIDTAIAAGKAVIQPAAAVATGGWGGMALELGGWLAAALAGGKAVHSQVRHNVIGKAFKQTVDGLKSVRSHIGEEQWKETIAPHLAKAQDEDVRTRVIPAAERQA